MIELKDGTLFFLLNNGQLSEIKSTWSNAENPLTAKRVMDGEWIFLGSFEADGASQIDFLSLRGFQQIARWTLGPSGDYLHQTHLNVSAVGPLNKRIEYKNLNIADNIIDAGRKYSNDLQIYLALKYILDDEVSADKFMDDYAPELNSVKSETGASAGCRMFINFIFNHNYARNIKKLDANYGNRFSGLQYILPNVAPSSERCFALPVGSFSYHMMIYYMIDKICSSKGFDSNAWYMFAHDDVYLNSNLSETTVLDFVKNSGKLSSLYYINVLESKWDFKSDWLWNKRVLDSLQNQRSTEVGNGFEGLNVFFDPSLLCNGIGDIFVVKGEHINLFGQILGNYISQDVFPEVAIPSSLKALAMMTKTEVGEISGDFLWGEERGLVDKNFIDEFDKTSKLFFHPVKADLMIQNT